jgi:polyisoprenoid-binding protein YceI
MSNTTDSQDATSPAASAAAGRWVLDPAHSSVRFRSKTFWGLLTVKGTFGAVSGEGEVAADGSAHGTLTIETASVDTKSAKRDTHLRSADFLDSDQHATLVFTATSVTPAADGNVDVSGDLAVRGTSRPLTFPARVTSTSPQEATLEAEVAIDRADFGITWNQLGMLTGHDTVTVTARYRHEG